jgi:hypothetical protein
LYPDLIIRRYISDIAGCAWAFSSLCHYHSTWSQVSCQIVNDSDTLLPSDTSSWSITATFNVSCAERSKLLTAVCQYNICDIRWCLELFLILSATLKQRNFSEYNNNFRRRNALHQPVNTRLYMLQASALHKRLWRRDESASRQSLR